MKRIFLLLCSITFNMVYALAGIYTDPNTNVNYNYYGSTATVNGGYSQSGSPDATGNIEILASFTVDGTTYNVTGIGDYAFKSNTGITSVVIPESITKIGKHAFYGCTNLSSISIFCAEALIGESAFSGCENLKAVHIADLGAWCRIAFYSPLAKADYSESNPLYYAKHLYINGEEVKNLRIPEGIEIIHPHSFYGLQLDTVSLPNTINTIFYKAFGGCSIRHLYCPTNPTHNMSVHGDLVGNGHLTNVHVANLQWLCGIETNTPHDIRGHFWKVDHLYIGDDELTNLVIPEDVHKIDDGLFEELECLQSVVIPDNTLTIIPSNAFNHCINLKSVTIGNSVSSISESAFYNCYNLVSVILPNTIKEISKYAFYFCI